MFHTQTSTEVTYDDVVGKTKADEKILNLLSNDEGIVESNKTQISKTTNSRKKMSETILNPNLRGEGLITPLSLLGLYLPNS